MPPLPLWPEGVPGRVDPDLAADPRALAIPTLTPYLRTTETPIPLLVVCPGGGYGGLADHEGEPVALWLNSLGLHAAVCRYRVFPWRHPYPLNDAKQALRLVRHHADAWKVDAKRVGILGFSAGGHLACSVANFGDDGDPGASSPVDRRSSRAQALIACYPVITSGPHAHRGSFANLLGDRVEPSLSLETSVGPTHPPAFLWHTADDPAVPVENALLYATALRAARVPFALHIYPSAPCHGIGLGRDVSGSASRWTSDCEAWLREIRWI